MKIVAADAPGIAEAAEQIRMSNVVAYPTETVYGLGVDPFSKDAVRKLFAAKGRPESNPILLIAADIEQVKEVVQIISPTAQKYIDAFWPGPLSLVLPKAQSIPDEITASGPTVCVRVPASHIARDLCRAVGHAITSTSANRSGEPPSRSVNDLTLDDVSLYLDGGALIDSLPSTVFNPETRTVLRAGAIPAETLLGI